jgi:predicted O-methyltransferase YrrM
LPALGGWAATARSVLAIVEEIQRAPGPVTVLDCGSGSSTVLDALLLKQRGAGGHVYALEADPAFAAETRGYLRAHGAEDFGTVVDAPVTEVVLPDGDRAPWYDVAALPDIGQVDVLFVDGPIGSIAHHARYPAFPLLADRLADGALVVLDDTNRPDEKEIVRRWVEEEHAGRRLTVLRTHGRATLLRVSRDL